MNGYYYIINTLRDHIKNNGFTNTVTTGNIFDVDLAKQTIFPLVHIMVNNASLNENTIGLNVSILFMDIVDESKSEITDKWLGNDNEEDVLNTQLMIASRLVSDMLRGVLYSNLVQTVAPVLCEPFTDRFENKLAGWTATFDVIIPNDMTIC
jgi:hypothetical protein